jgi:hypothetical protein
MPRYAWNKSSPGVKARYFELIRQGWSGSSASEAVGVSLSCGSLWFIDAGSVSYVETPIDSRYLSQDDRIEIADGLARKEPVKAIAARIGKTHQSVYREIARNRKPDGRYQPWYAHNQAHLRRRRSKAHKFETDPELRRVVAGPVGVFFGLMGMQASVTVAVVCGLGAMAVVVVMWRVVRFASRRRRQLDAGDDAKVTRVVLAGTDIEEDRLTPAVLELATQSRQNLESLRFAGRRRPLLAVVLALGVVSLLLDGQVWTAAAVGWSIFVVLVASPRVKARLLANARAAEAAARRHLADPPADTDLTPGRSAGLFQQAHPEVRERNGIAYLTATRPRQRNDSGV